MYGTTDQADTYFSTIGFTNWETLSTEQKTSALVSGSNILDALYTHRFPGQKTGGFQQVDQWPRINAKTRFGEVIPEDVVPDPIIHAAFEITRSEVTKPNSILPATFTGQQIKRQKLDVLEREFFKNDQVDQYSHLPYLPLIEGLIFDFIYSGTGEFPVFWVR